MKRVYSSLLLALAGLLLIIAVGSNPKYSYSVVDVSWPNCSIKNSTQYQSGIIGVNGGLDFKPNKCADKEASDISNYMVYMNTGYPGSAYGLKFKSKPLDCSTTDYLCLGYNYGYNAALYSINYASESNIHSNFWWLDVETDNSWTNNTEVNKAVLVGALAAIKENIFYASSGFYSVNDQWNSLTNSWHSDYPEWLGAGALNETTAKGLCTAPSFTGAPILLSQYTTYLDFNVVCHALPS